MLFNLVSKTTLSVRKLESAPGCAEEINVAGANNLIQRALLLLFCAEEIINCS